MGGVVICRCTLLVLIDTAAVYPVAASTLFVTSEYFICELFPILSEPP